MLNLSKDKFKNTSSDLEDSLAEVEKIQSHRYRGSRGSDRYPGLRAFLRQMGCINGYTNAEDKGRPSFDARSFLQC